MKRYLKIFKSGQFFRAVCIGDSTTSQEWCHPNWIDWLNFTFRETDNWQEDWKRKFINSGRDGGTIEHFIEYFKEEVRLYQPHVVIVSIGLNNLIPTFDSEEMKDSLKGLFYKIKNINSDLITWSPYAIPKKRYLDDLEKISNIYKSLTNEFEGVFIDIYREFLKYDLDKLFTFISDGNEVWGIEPGKRDFLHCNVAGNQIIAEKIAKEGFGESLSNWEFGTMKLLDLSNFHHQPFSQSRGKPGEI